MGSRYILVPALAAALCASASSPLPARNPVPTVPTDPADLPEPPLTPLTPPDPPPPTYPGPGGAAQRPAEQSPTP